jgi:pimeloyl-ACP methyl ester carboxylesterase
VNRTRFLASSAASVAAAAVPLAAHAESSEYDLTTATGMIAGTLERPMSAAGSYPVVLFIAGSGPTDRDGNNPMLPGKNDALKQLALALALRGIASVRYDKRGIAASSAAGPSEADLRFDTYVADAVDWVRKLRADQRFMRVTIAGHSEGSLVGMIAAVRALADGYVSLEGAGRPAPVVLREQLDKQLAGVPELRAQADHAIDELAAGRTVADPPAALAALFHTSVQPYLISWFKYDPAREIAAVRGRAAIVQGTADVQVTVADGDRLHAALPSASYVVVQGMNHVLKHAPDTSSTTAVLAGYTDPALPVEPAVVDAVVAVAR